jgi:hypothetical protein
VYVAPPAAAFGPPSKKDPDQHNRDPPKQGGGLVMLPLIVVVPEMIVNGIESVRRLDVNEGFETLRFAFVSVKVPG